MSHFIVGVIVPKRIHGGPDDAPFELTPETSMEKLEQVVEYLLAPYDENIETDPQETTCHCVEYGAYRRASEYATLQAGTVDSYRESFGPVMAASGLKEMFYDWPEGTPEREIDQNEEARQALWEEHIRSYMYALGWFKENDPHRGMPKPDCEECHGTGRTMTTYNPKSKWDWWVIGGRWHGYFDGKDVAWVRDTDPEQCPFAIVTPDGEWHEKGEMGWFGVVSEEKSGEEWRATRDAIYAECLHHVVVGVDCHI